MEQFDDTLGVFKLQITQMCI